ncbi:MAG: 4-hydroxy-3-methylbut-2-en-yl diphosphate reductase [Phycisphaerales bacterium]|nr:4-hydroxy-3-methylbut-2-en-yl diphosphate reductase [Phycisphaerales bacterium]
MAGMKVVLCKPRGFCAGVNMAIDCVEQVLRMQGPPVYVFHEIVHNRHVVQRFVDRGVTFVDSVDEVPIGATIVFSAHGVSPAVRRDARKRNLVQVDATCPLVAKVHSEAIRYARQKFTIVLIGHRNHDEIVGTLGEAPDCTHVVENIREVEALQVPPDHRMAYLTQTTLSLDDAEAIIAALRKKYPHIRSPLTEDICYATTNRQWAVRELATDCDLVLVVGSANSSNSKRLVETAEQRGVKSYLIDDASCLEQAWLDGVKTVLLTAGASAPEDLVQEVVEVLRSRYGASIEEREVTLETLSFELPVSVRALMNPESAPSLA